VLFFTTLSKTPSVHRKLVQELDAANLTLPVSYNSTYSLPYLETVIKESARIHPGVGLLLGRIVPEVDLTLTDGTVIPPGTIAGMNLWVIHQNKTIFGQDAEPFGPKRWLRNEADRETKKDYQTRLTAMKHADLAFGAGKRVCVDRNMSIMETYKAIATLFLTDNGSYPLSQGDTKCLRNKLNIT